MVILTMKTSGENGERKPAMSWHGDRELMGYQQNSNFNVGNAVTNAVVTYEIWG